MLNPNPHPNHNRKTVCNSNLTLTLTLTKTLTCYRARGGDNLQTIYPNDPLLKYKNRGTSVPGNIGTGEHRFGEHRYRGT